LHIADVFEAQAKCAQTARRGVRRSGVEKPDHRHRRLLRGRRERPRGRRTTNKRDELAPPHGTYPKAKDRRLTIAGLERVGGVRRSKNQWLMSEMGHSRRSAMSAQCPLSRASRT